MPWLFGAVPPLVIFHTSGGAARWQRCSSCRSALPHATPRSSSAGQLCWAPRKLSTTPESLASPLCLGKKGLPGGISSVKQSPLSVLSGNSDGEGGSSLSSSSLLSTSLVPSPLWVLFSLPEVPLQLLPPPPPPLHLPTHLQLSSPQSLVSDKPCDDAAWKCSCSLFTELLRCLQW